MRRAFLACAALLVSCGSALAQVVIETPGADVYVAPRAYAPPPPSVTYEVQTYRPAPRVYEYRSRGVYEVDDDDDVVVERRYRSGCGAHHRWDGYRCVYFRY